MTLQYIREAEVACSELDQAIAFYTRAFGFEVREDASNGALLGAPGAPAGQLRLVQTDAEEPAEPPRMWDLGPRLLGMYSRDLEATTLSMSDAGASVGPIATYPYGAGTLSELVAYGRDGVHWTVPLARAGAHRPSAAYDADPARVHSELHSAVLVVDDHDAAVAFFVAGGLQVVFDGGLEGPEVEKMCGLPPGGALRLAFLGGVDHAPARLEIMSLTGVPTQDRSQDPIGLRRLHYVCDDIAGTRDALLAAGAVALPDGALRGPVGVEIQLVEDKHVEAGQ